MKDIQPTVAIDFDGVLHSFEGGFVAPNIIQGTLKEGAKEFVDNLVQDGFRIVIHSCRANTFTGAVAIGEWLQHHSIHYDNIIEKPLAHYYIDDRAVEFGNSFGALRERMIEIDKLAW